MMNSSQGEFQSSDPMQNYSSEVPVNGRATTSENIDLAQFSTVDLDQRSTCIEELSRLPELNTSLSTGQTAWNNVGLTSSPESSARRSFPSNSTANRFSIHRISTPDLSKISASSAAAMAAVAPTLGKLKHWSRVRLKCTKQSLYEKLGKSTRTVDAELENRIEQLRDTKRRYEAILALARSYANHLKNLMSTQRGLSEGFFQLKEKLPVLSDEFGYNAETQRILVQNGENLLNALNYFISTLQTLCTKTIEDTIITIRHYELSRLEYDASRTELELLTQGPHYDVKEQEFLKYKKKYEKYKADVAVKLRLLEENQVHVMKHQLLLFHNAIAAYFSGNKQSLDSTIEQFHLKIRLNGEDYYNRNSFIEHIQH